MSRVSVELVRNAREQEEARGKAGDVKAPVVKKAVVKKPAKKNKKPAKAKR